MTEPASK